jgi:hypothetical protein
VKEPEGANTCPSPLPPQQLIVSFESSAHACAAERFLLEKRHVSNHVVSIERLERDAFATHPD